MSTSKIKILFGAAALAAAAAAVAGCGDARAANSKNLEHALNNDYSVNSDCLFAKPLPFPYSIAVNDPLLSETHRRLDAMVAAGLLKRDRSAGTEQALDEYSLTALGADTAGKGRFCYGRRVVTAIEKISPPEEYQGMPLTRVQYRFELKSRAPWINQLQGAFPKVAKSLSSEPIDEATLVLTNDGWELTY